MIITIGGQPGAGSTTVSRLLAEKLGYRLVTMGEMWKSLAQERGYKPEDIDKFWAEKGGEKDLHLKLDALQKRIALEDKKVVFNGKLSAFQLPNADLKIFITADLSARAERTAKRDKIGVEQAKREISKREREERTKWKEIYSFDYVADKEAYDMIIDSSDIGARKISGIIEKKIMEMEG